MNNFQNIQPGDKIRFKPMRYNKKRITVEVAKVEISPRGTVAIITGQRFWGENDSIWGRRNESWSADATTPVEVI